MQTDSNIKFHPACHRYARHLYFIVIVFITIRLSNAQQIICIESSKTELSTRCRDNINNNKSNTENVFNDSTNDINNNKDKINGRCKICSDYLPFVVIPVDNMWRNFGDELIHCGLASLTSISDSPYFSRFVMQFIFGSGTPFVEVYREGMDYVFKDDFHKFENFLRKAYVEDTQQHFILTTENPEVVLNQVEDVFLGETYGELALLPHRTKWVVIVWTERQWERVVAQQTHSVLDNVLLVKVKKQTPKAALYDIETISTFMWRQNRKREPSIVDPNSLNSKKCVLFPNEHKGLNGRELVVAPKMSLQFFLDKEKSENGGEKYTGYLFDVLNYCSMYSNFTFVMKSPRNESFSGISWFEYEDYLNNGSMEIGLSAWSTLFSSRYNLSFSFPVMFDTLVGIYRRPMRQWTRDSWVFVCPFPAVGYLYLWVCVLYISSLYIITIGKWHFFHSKCPEEIVNGSVFYSTYKLEAVLGESQSEKNGVRFRDRFIVKTYNFLLYYVATISSFLVAVLNQSYLPRPCQMSAKLLVGVWAIGMVFFYASFSSFITAQRIMPDDDLPFTTFKGFLESGYSGNMLKETILEESVMRLNNTRREFILLKQKTHVINVSVFNDVIFDRNLPQYLKNMGHDVVFFHYHTFLQSWVNSRARTKDYVIMDNDPIFNSDVAIVFPYKSQLREVISRDIMRIHESGVQRKMFKRYNLSSPSSSRNKFSYLSSQNTLQIRHLFWLGIICLICLGLSLTVLGLEIRSASRMKTQVVL